MITVQQYLTQHATEAPDDVRANAEILLPMVMALLADPDCPSPNVGLRSGYRPAAFNAATKGASPTSKHMTGQAIDLNDSDGALDAWLTDEILAQYGLYREHPDATPSWLHVQYVPPHSDNRTFRP